MAATNSLDTPPTTPPPAPKLSKADRLSDVLSLATLFSACVEAFNLIFPSKDSDHAQKIALAKLGLQQGRLLIFGDVVGISSPPANIARHMVPSHPAATNPDPNLPVNFGVRDPRLDDAGTNKKVRAALDEIAGRPAHLTREELMEKYGLRSPKRFQRLEYPALDTNRLESFREKYALLQDLARQIGAKGAPRRAMSMTVQHWTVSNVHKFDSFVKTVKEEVDGLITFMDVKEKVDRAMKTDIRAMGWHPDLSGPVVRQDWEKLRLIREACHEDYPEYVEVTDYALNYISEELKGAGLVHLMKQFATPPPTPTKRKSEDATKEKQLNGSKSPGRERRSSGFFNFKFSWGRSSKDPRSPGSNNITSPSSLEDPQRSLSEATPKADTNSLEPGRSQSMSAVPDRPVPVALHSKIENAPTTDLTQTDSFDVEQQNPLMHADTAHSLVERHDMFKGAGRIETRDIREMSHDRAR
ncbi:hypothetical protein CC78DRAFT_532242 [Lojkania enalia]|uniref:Prion-inhibition and propagation HeLo domain-containing protein n=1 Tax=Lojkania enalia TaxID=147567 RepID=A0A9P4KC93_9PLEO|nr:hypothetical protein CC78DRAFT_532242 [Didymosphaeria enalia]